MELYEFQKRYPHAETKVNAYLSQTGNYFQSYIRRGLNNLSAEDDSMKFRPSANNDTTDASSVRSAEGSSPRTSRPQSTGRVFCNLMICCMNKLKLICILCGVQSKTQWRSSNDCYGYNRSLDIARSQMSLTRRPV